MKFQISTNLFKIITELINAKYVGDENFQVLEPMKFTHVKRIVFVNHPKYYDKALFLRRNYFYRQKVDCPEGKALLFQMILSEILIKLMNIIKVFKLF